MQRVSDNCCEAADAGNTVAQMARALNLGTADTAPLQIPNLGPTNQPGECQCNTYPNVQSEPGS